MVLWLIFILIVLLLEVAQVGHLGKNWWFCKTLGNMDIILFEWFIHLWLGWKLRILNRWMCWVAFLYEEVAQSAIFVSMICLTYLQSLFLLYWIILFFFKKKNFDVPTSQFPCIFCLIAYFAVPKDRYPHVRVTPSPSVGFVAFCWATVTLVEGVVLISGWMFIFYTWQPSLVCAVILWLSEPHLCCHCLRLESWLLKLDYIFQDCSESFASSVVTMAKMEQGYHRLADNTFSLSPLYLTRLSLVKLLIKQPIWAT